MQGGAVTEPEVPEPGSSPSQGWATCCSGRTPTGSARRHRRSCGAARLTPGA